MTYNLHVQNALKLLKYYFPYSLSFPYVDYFDAFRLDCEELSVYRTWNALKLKCTDEYLSFLHGTTVSNATVPLIPILQIARQLERWEGCGWKNKMGGGV